MSRFLTEKLRVFIGRERIELIRLAPQWFSTAERSRTQVALDPNANWLNQIQRALQGALHRTAGMTVDFVISDAVVKQRVVPCPQGVHNLYEFDAAVAAEFFTASALSPTEWQVASDWAYPRTHRLVVALEQTLLQSVQHAAQVAGTQIQRVTSQFAQCITQHARKIRQRSAWVVVPDENHVTVARIAAGLIHSVHTYAWDQSGGSEEEIQAYLLRHAVLYPDTDIAAAKCLYLLGDWAHLQINNTVAALPSQRLSARAKKIFADPQMAANKMELRS